ncbi:Gfo/Idh/MocA family protein [Sutcliffiella horikoshii]|uniref:Gfo/Idh/MocA family protein n=1 Tax=Sutcliffiella horikoshii TaxID=79883 RepID=UPI001F26CAA1|nr:Gfo/Idh/MocA family oxidoreductase [Sutcliffiella horikoshii]MCG1021565.1 Gfo/Idh/MocA family oxidoreductase [Sutcliffiella horikoshii]
MINFAIVGIGHISKKHMDAIANIEGAQVVALCDNNELRLKEYEGQFELFSDLETMLKEQTNIDVVNICVPSGLHANMTKICANYNKHVIAEKPMALKLQDAEEMIKVCEENGVKLAIVHPNRYRPAFLELRRLFDNNIFGKISHANATVRWNRNDAYYAQAPWRGTKEFDGGVLMNQAIHDLDLLLWFMGEVESVQAMATTRLRNIEAEDVAAAVVTFKSGALGIIEAATTIYPKNLEESLAIFGENASIKISGQTAINFEVLDAKDLKEEEKIEIIERVKNDPFGTPGHQHIIQDMVVSINEGKNPNVDGQAGIAPVRLILAILESAETGKRVYL